MRINVTYDQNTATLPAGFVAAINYVVNYFDSTFTNPVTVNIHVGYGEIAGQSLGTGALGESETFIDSASYTQTIAALQANQLAPAQLDAYSTLPASSPLPGGTLWMATAEEKALGLLAPNDPSVDGYVGFSSVYPFNYGINSRPGAGQYYFVGVVEHEITEVIGRDSWLGDGLGGTTSYGVMDLFRYSAPGVRDLTVTPPSPYNIAYFSINNGATNLDNWNTNPNGDLGDWAASAGADALLAFSPSGQINQFTAADLELMNVLGWDVPVTRVVIQTDASTSLALINGQYYYLLNSSSGFGPSLKYGGADVLAGGWGPWSPIGAIQTATGYDVAWKTSDGQFSVWATDSNGNYTSNLIVVVPGTSVALELLESTFGQDLNGDGVIGVSKQVIQTDGSTSLTLVAGQTYYLFNSSSGAGPSLKYGGTDVVAGNWGAWVPFGAVQTSSGYDVAWKMSGGQYSVWATDNNGNYVSNLIVVAPGTSTALEGLEPTFGQDLNGDGVIGVNLTKQVIQTDGSTSLTLVGGQSYYLLNSSSGAGPSLKYNGADVMLGHWGPWAPIGAVQTATGYDVAWKSSDGQYSVWATDINGNYVSNLVVVAPGTSAAVEGLEPTFNQDLNGDGVIGVNLTKQVIQTDGSTSLALVGGQSYYLLNSSSGTGPSLKYNGADVMLGHWGPWAPIGAVQTTGGYDVAWKTSDGQYSVWATDSNGNYVSNLIVVVPGTSTALEGLEPTFGQDLNGDGVIGVVGSAGATSAGTLTSAATLTVSNTFGLSGVATLGYSVSSATSSTGEPTLGDTSNVGRLTVLSQYMAASFAAPNTDHGSSLVTEPPSSPQSFLAQPH